MNRLASPISPTFTKLLEEFFGPYILQQRSLSPRTIASYRDTFVLMLKYAETDRLLPAYKFRITDLSAQFLADFLEYLEKQRNNSIRSRNTRLAAIRSFLKFAARRDLPNIAIIEQALAVPMKRFDRQMVGFLPRELMLAVIDATTDTWIGQRDRLMLTLMFNTGARVSEVTGLRASDVIISSCSSIRLNGKGRKLRSLPLWKTTAKAIQQWLKLNPQINADSPLLPTKDGTPMTRANVTRRLAVAVNAASIKHPQLNAQRVSPHTIRHTTAMCLLQSGSDPCEIALWLGHESPSTTHMYVEADLAMKDKALARLEEPTIKQQRYKPPKGIMEFLQSL